MSEKITKKCPVCGTMLIARENHCPACGESVGAIEAVVPFRASATENAVRVLRVILSALAGVGAIISLLLMVAFMWDASFGTALKCILCSVAGMAVPIALLFAENALHKKSVIRHEEKKSEERRACTPIGGLAQGGRNG